MQIALHRYQLDSLHSLKVGQRLCWRRRFVHCKLLLAASGITLAALIAALAAALTAASACQQANGQQDAVNSFREVEAAATQTCPEAAQRASAPGFRSPQQLLQQV